MQRRILVKAVAYGMWNICPGSILPGETLVRDTVSFSNWGKKVNALTQVHVETVPCV